MAKADAKNITWADAFVDIGEKIWDLDHMAGVANELIFSKIGEDRPELDEDRKARKITEEEAQRLTFIADHVATMAHELRQEFLRLFNEVHNRELAAS